MKGLFWNSRGLSDLAKYRYIADIVKANNLDVIAVLETGKQDMSRSNLARLSGGVDFTWHYLPPRGRSGGILLGIKTSSMDVLAFSNGEFHIKFHVRNKADNFTWSLVAVYGAAQEEHKTTFLRELVNLAKDNPYPIL